MNAPNGLAQPECKQAIGDPVVMPSDEHPCEHRGLLTRFAQQHDDPLVADLLVEEVKPIPFPHAPSRKDKPKRGKSGK